MTQLFMISKGNPYVDMCWKGNVAEREQDNTCNNWKNNKLWTAGH